MTGHAIHTSVAKPPTVPGIRTRLHVQVDRLRAGLPFYVKPQEWR